MLVVESPAGGRYLDLVTRLLQDRRLADRTAGVWEAADFQWWWRQDRHDDPSNARFWLDGARPVAAVVLTQWQPDRLGCDVLANADFELAWAFAADGCAKRRGARIEMVLPDADSAAHAAARRANFASTEEFSSCLWLSPAQRRRPRRPLSNRYRVVSRKDDSTRRHPLARRNGDRVEDHLQQCSLYNPAFDLAVVGPNDEVAGYALFWPDVVTGVGLVEPMRIEDAHAGQALGAHLLDAGLRLLADAGCRYLKVAVEPGNAAAAMLYAGAGFIPSGFDRVWLHHQ